MLKTKLKDMPVITLHLNPGDKKVLDNIAQSKGLQLATYCRMVLLDKIKEYGKDNGEH